MRLSWVSRDCLESSPLFSQPQAPSPWMTHDAFGRALVVTTEPKKLFSWKYAGILVGVKLGMAAVAYGLYRAGVDPSWFSFGR